MRGKRSMHIQSRQLEKFCTRHETDKFSTLRAYNEPEVQRQFRSPRKKRYLLGIPGVKLIVKRASERYADEVRGEENEGGL